MCYTTESYEDDVSVLRQINPNIIALDEKTLEAERRSYHTFFDVHVVETRDGYILIEEGDYGELPMHLIDQIVYTATGKMAEAKDQLEKASAAHFDNPQIHFELSRVYARLGDRDGAAEQTRIVERLRNTPQ